MFEFLRKKQTPDEVHIPPQTKAKDRMPLDRWQERLEGEVIMGAVAQKASGATNSKNEDMEGPLLKQRIAQLKIDKENKKDDGGLSKW